MNFRIARCHDLICRCLILLQNFEGAQAHAQKALDANHEVFRSPHHEIACSYHLLAKCQKIRCLEAEALENYRKALAMQKRALKQDEPDTLDRVDNLLQMFQGEGDVCNQQAARGIKPDVKSACAVYEEARHFQAHLISHQRSFGDEFLAVLELSMATTFQGLAWCYAILGEAEKALSHYRSFFAIAKRLPVPSHVMMLAFMNAASLYKQERNWQEAKVHYQELMAFLSKEKRLGDAGGSDVAGHADTITVTALCGLGTTCSALGEHEEALLHFKMAYELEKETSFATSSSAASRPILTLFHVSDVTRHQDPGSQAFLHLARHHYQQKQYAETVNLFEQHDSAVPEGELHMFAESCAKMGKHELAAEVRDCHASWYTG
jgi:tetratricopeptide (TPR) repeat protein